MLSPRSAQQILIRSSLQLQLASRIRQTWLPLDYINRFLHVHGSRLLAPQRSGCNDACGTCVMSWEMGSLNAICPMRQEPAESAHAEHVDGF